MNTGFILFKLNYDFYFHIVYKKDVNPKFEAKLMEELSIKLRELMTICWENLYYTQKL